ncbi:MAG: ABC transporter permease [Oscillospiraceae bacterium]|nr:ABC transporter permease [Oscillospiraceae bacterium]MCL2278488.1 ABC transporter permease [Oscillospiraceae bacterium]
MELTKKRLAGLTVSLTVIYFIPLLYLPESIVGDRPDNFLLFLPRILFFAITAAIATAFILLLLFKRDFITGQLFAFSRYKYYIGLMIKRDFVSRYRKSILGIIWSTLNPLLMMIVMAVVFSYLFRFDIPHVAVYIFSGQLIFNFFSEGTSTAMNSIISNEAIIKKIYVPKYVFPLTKVLTASVNMGFTFIAFLFVLFFSGIEFHWTVFLVPIPIIYTFVFTLGISMFISSFAVFFRDITHLWGVFMQLVFFLTPIMYPVEILPEWIIPFYWFNPMVHFVEYFRELTMLGTVPNLWANMVCIGFALASLCMGTFVFMSRQDKYILNM